MGAEAKPAGAALVEFGMMSPVAVVKDAANAAFEKIDPLVHKEVITVHYDKDRATRDRAVASLQLMGTKAKAAVPVIKNYHFLLLSGTGKISDHSCKHTASTRRDCTR